MPRVSKKKLQHKKETKEALEKFLKRPLSWSSISQFRYDPSIWYDKYINGAKQRPTGPIVFGKNVGERLASEPTFLPEVPRLKEYEHELKVDLGGIQCIGYLDNFDLENRAFAEFKTGKNWTQKKAESHGQIDMYCAMIYLKHGIKPEELDIKLIWLPTEQRLLKTDFVKDMQPVVFPIKKTMRDILTFMVEVQKTHKEMLEYIETYLQQPVDKDLQKSTASSTL